MVSARHFVEVEDFARYLRRRGLRPSSARLALFWALPPAGVCFSAPGLLARARRYRRHSRLCRRTVDEMMPLLQEAGLVLPDPPVPAAEPVAAPVPAFFSIPGNLIS